MSINAKIRFDINVLDLDVGEVDEDELAQQIHDVIDTWMIEYINKKTLNQKWLYDIDTRILENEYKGVQDYIS